MRILMLTNVYTPLVGGVTRSIQTFTGQFQQHGHDVMIVAPSTDNDPEDEDHVVRYPAIPQFYQHKYSLPIMIPGLLMGTLIDFQPDVIHSHHPFLLGRSAQHSSAIWDVPLVYTHHSRYDKYIDQTTDWGRRLNLLVQNLVVDYCRVADAVVAPSRSIAEMLPEDLPGLLRVIPTGIDTRRFGQGDGQAFRQNYGLSEDVFVVGHLGRLAPEKNCGFLSAAVVAFLQQNPAAHCVIVGDGPSRGEIEKIFQAAECAKRLHITGILEGQELVDAYHAMDVFAFASQSETQGIVIVEAMAAGIPVVAVDASGIREVVLDNENGYLLAEEDCDTFAAALKKYCELATDDKVVMQQQARQTAEHFSQEACTNRLLELYEEVITHRKEQIAEEHVMKRTQRFFEFEWNSWSQLANSLSHALFDFSGPSQH